MSVQDEINETNRKLEELKRKQQNCQHKWDNTEGRYNPESYMDSEIIQGDFSECHGSDYWPATRSVTKTRDRWTRTCTCCGLEQHTYETEVKKVVEGPKFK